VKKKLLKKLIKKPVKRSREIDATGALDWTPLFAAFREAFDWALDVASALARAFPEEVEAVERVRRFMRARITGEESHVRVDDVLFTFGLIIGAIERDLGPIGERAPWFAMPMQAPVSLELWEPWVPRQFASDLWIRTAPVGAGV
jgi:hypothetical protein